MELSLRLYVAGDAPNSQIARANLSAMVGATARVEIVDVFEHPERARKDGVFVTPMLVKVAPLPQCTIVGNLSDRELLRRMLGLEEERR